MKDADTYYEKDRSYNFDIKEVSKKFSFLNFVDEAKKSELNNYKGFIVITDSNYLIGYTSHFGKGTHYGAFARVMKDIKGGGLISGQREEIYLIGECRTYYITGRILCEKQLDNENGISSYLGRIHFTIPKEINNNMINQFKKFYNEYNSEIELVIKRNNNFSVSYSTGSNDNVKGLNNLDEILNILEEKKNLKILKK